MTKKLTPSQRFAINSSAIAEFKKKARIDTDNGLVWNTYCNVTYTIGSQTINEAVEIFVKEYSPLNGEIELRGFKISDHTVEKASFNPKYGSFEYTNEGLKITGVTQKKVKYHLVIGEYDAKLAKDSMRMAN